MLCRTARQITAITSLNLQYVTDPRTTNKRLDGLLVTGTKKDYAKILTKPEEEKFVQYLLNRNRACQRLSEPQAAKVVLNILRTRKQLNKNKGRNYRPLSDMAKNCLLKNKVGWSFFHRLRAEHPKLKRKTERENFRVGKAA